MAIPLTLVTTGSHNARANGAINEGRGVAHSGVDSSGRPRVVQASVDSHATLSSVSRAVGIAKSTVADTEAIEYYNMVGARIPVIGGGVVAADKDVTVDADGKFIEAAATAGEYLQIWGRSVDACAADGDWFTIVFEPTIVGSGITAGDDLAVTDDLTVGDDATITGDLTAGTITTAGALAGGATTLGATTTTTLAPSGALTAGAAIKGKQGADVASANDLVLPADGNVFEITGTTQINHIASTNWQNGSEVTLVFTSTPTVKASQATSGVNLLIMLAAGADFVASANDLLTLVLCEMGGTQVWREKCRSVNA